jgi:hypothetical protein
MVIKAREGGIDGDKGKIIMARRVGMCDVIMARRVGMCDVIMAGELHISIENWSPCLLRNPSLCW